MEELEDCDPWASTTTIGPWSNRLKPHKAIHLLCLLVPPGLNLNSMNSRLLKISIWNSLDWLSVEASCWKHRSLRGEFQPEIICSSARWSHTLYIQISRNGENAREATMIHRSDRLNNALTSRSLRAMKSPRTDRCCRHRSLWGALSEHFALSGCWCSQTSGGRLSAEIRRSRADERQFQNWIDFRTE